MYCIPEICGAREIALYKAEDFPYRWKKVAVLINSFAGVDSTIFRYQGRWWLTSTDGAAQSTNNSHLFVWHATEVFGPWVPHVANPVKIDASSSRPAGTPFVHNGYLYRPAQDCSRIYGARIVLNRVLSLTPFEFKEECASVIEPCLTGPYPNGLHTISAVGGITVIDGKRHVFNKHAFKTALVSLLRSRPASAS